MAVDVSPLECQSNRLEPRFGLEGRLSGGERCALCGTAEFECGVGSAETELVKLAVRVSLLVSLRFVTLSGTEPTSPLVSHLSGP